MEELNVVVQQTPGVITTNFAELKMALKEQMQIYKELTVTEANKAERKKDISTLKKIQKAINDERIKQERIYIGAFESYKAESKEMIEIINEPILLIDHQVKEMEDKARLAKIAEIKEYFSEVSGELKEFVSLDQIYDSKWENITCSVANAKKELSKKVADINRSVDLIKAMKSEKEEQALDELYAALDVKKAIALINNYEQQKKEIEERLKRQAEMEELRKAEAERKEKERILEEERARVRREEQERIAAEQRIAAAEREKVLAEQKEREQAEKEAEKEFLSVKNAEFGTELNVYMITATQEEFEMLEMYMDSVGIEFQKGE